MLSSQKSDQINVRKAYVGQQGSPPCIWPLIRLSPEPVFSVAFYGDARSSFLLHYILCQKLSSTYSVSLQDDD
jgi:hypothetical protein